jgi:hypothetical protein
MSSYKSWLYSILPTKGTQYVDTMRPSFLRMASLLSTVQKGQQNVNLSLKYDQKLLIWEHSKNEFFGNIL